MESSKQTYEKQELNLVSVVKEVINQFETTKKQHQFTVNSLEDVIMILGDEEKLVQLLTNLISNAVKFSPEGGKVSINFKVAETEVVLSVEDEGLGIPAEEVANLFQKFYRIDNSDRRKIGGTGLGLAISKQIVKAHNGEISVSSKLGKGSTFIVKLPRVSEPIIEKTLIMQQNNDLPLLIIIEDDESLGMLLSDELKELELRVGHYSDGETAVTAIKKEIPQLIILDIMLGEKMDGWAVIEELKNNESTKSIPIIILSALDEKEKGIALGIDHYLTKPYPPSQLSVVVVDLLLKSRKAGEILIPTKEEDKDK